MTLTAFSLKKLGDSGGAFLSKVVQYAYYKLVTNFFWISQIELINIGLKHKIYPTKTNTKVCTRNRTNLYHLKDNRLHLL